MRLFEIASAEEQIALFKLVTDKVWQALADQKQQQAAQQKAAAAKRGSGKRRRRSSAKSFKPIPFVKPPAPIPPALPQPNAAATPKPTAKPQSQPTTSFNIKPVLPVATLKPKQPQSSAAESEKESAVGTAELLRKGRVAAGGSLR
jgi:hypothetical protein